MSKPPNDFATMLDAYDAVDPRISQYTEARDAG